MQKLVIINTSRMFIGHYGLAFASGKATKTIQLGTAIFAAQFLDLLWPVFTLAGWESFTIAPGDTKLTPIHFDNYPYTHSLLGSLILSVLFAMVYFLFKKDGRSALVYALLVFSHWVLDFLTHRPDLPLSYTSDQKLGLSLWNHPAVSIALECCIYAAGIFLYIKSTKPLNKKGSVLLWVLVSLLAVFYVMNLVGPPPPSEAAVSYSALLLWLFVPFGYWIDKNRAAAGN